VPFEIAQVRVHCFGTDELPSAGAAALRVEFYDASLHRHPPCPGAQAALVPAPRAPIPERQRRCRAPAPCIEPAAFLSGLTRAVGVAARPTYRLMDFAHEARRASAHPADPAPGCLPAATIADLAGT